MQHRYPLAVALGFAVCLIAVGFTGLPGDSHEYLALALNFSELNGPSIAPEDLPRYLQEIGGRVPDMRTFDGGPFMRRGPDGKFDYLHFWLYSLLAVPGVWLVKMVGAPLTYAFALLNIGLLLLAFRVALPRLGLALCVLLFASPIVWWLDKPHTEAYTFALLTIAVVLFREKPWWSLVAAGAAAAQNPVAFALLGVLLAASLVQGRRFLTNRRWLTGAAAGVLIGSLHVSYFWLRYGRPFLLTDATRSGSPVLAEIVSPVLDPTIGLFANFPAFALLLVAALGVVLLRRPRELLTLDVLVAATTSVAFLLGFARNVNYHHAATPSVSRYALWLIPLGIPLLRAASSVSGSLWTRGLWSVSLVSAVSCVVAFHPAVPDLGRGPTWVASYVWRQHPHWYNSLPEVFAETIRRSEGTDVPTATEGCEKILIGSPGPSVAWPIPCYPDVVPEWCLERYCYANLRGNQYDFVLAPGRDTGPGRADPGSAWPAGVERHVRELYTRWAWWTLTMDRDAGGIVRQGFGLRTTAWRGDTGVLLILRDIAPDAWLLMRPPGPAMGTVIDLRTGDPISTLTFAGEAYDAWKIAVPAGYDLLALTLTFTPNRS